MSRQYGDRVAFFVVYIQEAHASDAWQLPINIKENVVIENPENPGEKIEIANACIRKLNIEFPAVVDDFQNSTENAYTGWPDRLYIVDRDGRVAYKSKAGPFGFKPGELAETLVRIAPPTTQ